MPLIVIYKNGAWYEDNCATSHDDNEDSYSIAEAVNSILRDIQVQLEEKGYKFKKDLSEQFGIESVDWGVYYNPPDNYDVANFLLRFHNFEHDVTHTFIHGCCYWFAVMMHARFPDSRIMYAYKSRASGDTNNLGDVKIPSHVCHFVTEIDGRLYDITGDVTEKYEVKPWDEMDFAEKNRIESESVYWDDLRWEI